MTAQTRSGAIRVPFGVILIAWLVLGLLDVAQSAIGQATYDYDVDLPSLFSHTMPSYVWLALLTPLIFLLSDRFTVERPHPMRNIMVHAGAALIFPAVHLFASALTASLLPQVELTASLLARKWVFGFFAADVFRYGAVVALYHALLASHRSREQAVELEQVRAQAAETQVSLTDARLQSLASRLRPHFLFNSLNVISGLALRQEPERVAGVVTALSDLLRRSLRTEDNLITLGEEIDFVRAYLEIEQARLGDRLIVSIDIPESLLTLHVPSFVLQPIVENAVQHGVAAQPGSGRVGIRAFREGELVVLEVTDTGPGFTRSERPGGVGLSTTAARLEGIYGGSAALELSADEGRGARVRIRVPDRKG